MRSDIPVLEGWSSLPVAAEQLGATRQRLFQMGVEEDKLTSLRYIPGTGNRPAAYVVSAAELYRLRREQLTAAIKAAQGGDSEEGRADVEALSRQLDDVQLDAVRLLYVQLGLAADAAEVAGDADLVKLLRKRAENMQVPVAA